MASQVGKTAAKFFFQFSRWAEWLFVSHLYGDTGEEKRSIFSHGCKRGSRTLTAGKIMDVTVRQ